MPEKYFEEKAILYGYHSEKKYFDSGCIDISVKQEIYLIWGLRVKQRIQRTRGGLYGKFSKFTNTSSGDGLVQT
jgi:hypothetical protein